VAGNSTDTGRSVTSKVVGILLTFTDGSVHSLTEIARLAGLPVSTAHRLAGELTSCGVLERTNEGGYRVGQPLRAIGGRVGSVPSLRERARRVMEDLSAAAQTTVRLGVLDDAEVAFVEKGPDHRPVSAFCGAATMPAHATALGKALLAYSPPGTVDRLIARGLRRYTPYTLTAPDRLRRALAITRLTRVAVGRHEYEFGLSALAVPVFGPTHTLFAALEISTRNLGTDLRLSQPALVVAARSLSRELASCQSRRQVGRCYGGDATLRHSALTFGHATADVALPLPRRG
jgi:DNA-binding IclR family transcriptional regulator